MTELANRRGDDPAKYHIGIGQDQMARKSSLWTSSRLGANAAEVKSSQKKIVKNRYGQVPNQASTNQRQVL